MLLCGLVNAQTLKPTIGIGALPLDTDSVCDIPFYTGSFGASGYQPGDTVNDFTLYNINGDSLNLATAFLNGKPKLLIAGSYTCPVFRNKIQSINEIVTEYGSLIDVYIIYTVEAHTVDVPSPYFGFINVTTANQTDGILYAQPQTYGERKALVNEMLSDLNIQAPVFIDGPCNEWWLNYGPAPNNATLIDANGLVYAKHGWYDKFPRDISCDITYLLGLPPDCDTIGTAGTFAFNLISNDTMTGPAGTVVSIEAELINNSSEDVVIGMKRVQEQLPSGWESAFCLDVCYPTNVDSVTVLIAAGDTQLFHYYFFTNAVPGFGKVKIAMRNVNEFSNSGQVFFFAETFEEATGILSVLPTSRLTLSPNPATKACVVKWNPVSEPVHIIVTDITGRKLHQAVAVANTGQFQLDLSDLKPGMYFVSTESKAGTTTTQALVITD
ncbi:MAG TPA: T9SS type A sorting domain-containing protein [Chitinophagales bacterium]|nr:T9SS type A sorting domain-containing protein [Chitinophagales bacterium]